MEWRLGYYVTLAAFAAVAALNLAAIMGLLGRPGRRRSRSSRHLPVIGASLPGVVATIAVIELASPGTVGPLFSNIGEQVGTQQEETRPELTEEPPACRGSTQAGVCPCVAPECDSDRDGPAYLDRETREQSGAGSRPNPHSNPQTVSDTNPHSDVQSHRHASTHTDTRQILPLRGRSSAGTHGVHVVALEPQSGRVP